MRCRLLFTTLPDLFDRFIHCLQLPSIHRSWLINGWRLQASWVFFSNLLPSHCGLQFHSLYKQMFKFTWNYSFFPPRFSTLCLPRKPLLLRCMFTSLELLGYCSSFILFSPTVPLKVRQHKNALQTIEAELQGQGGTCSRSRPSKCPVFYVRICPDLISGVNMNQLLFHLIPRCTYFNHRTFLIIPYFYFSGYWNGWGTDSC